MKFLRFFSIIFAVLLASSFVFAGLSATLSLSDSSIAEGESTTLTVTISGSDSSVTAELSGDGILDGKLTTSPAAVAGISTQAVGSVSATTSKSWIIQGVTAGTYLLAVSVSGTESSTTGSTTLTVNTPANVVLQSSSCDSDNNLEDNEVFTVSYVLRNTGETSATILGTLSGDDSFSVSRSGTDASTSNEVTMSSGQTKTVVYSFTANAIASEQEGDIEIVLTGANNPDDPDVCSYTIAATTDDEDDSPGGGGGGGSSSEISLSVTTPATILLAKGSKKSFDYRGVSHSVTVNTVNADNATITIASNPSTYTLKVGEFAKKDLDADGYYDLKITLTEISSATAVRLSLLLISEKVSESPAQGSDTTQETTTKTSSVDKETAVDQGSNSDIATGNDKTSETTRTTSLEKSNFWLPTIVILILVLLVILGLSFVKKKGKESPLAREIKFTSPKYPRVKSGF